MTTYLSETNLAERTSYDLRGTISLGRWPKETRFLFPEVYAPGEFMKVICIRVIYFIIKRFLVKILKFSYISIRILFMVYCLYHAYVYFIIEQ